MFNHQQNHGAGMSHQQMMMQRLMASRQRSSGFMPTDMQMSTPAELHDRRFPPQMGWAPPHQQRTFGFPPQQNLLGFPNRSAELNNFGMVAPTSNPIPPPASIPTAATNSSSSTGSGGGFIGNSGMRMSLFKCPECNIVKNSSEDLEIHLKTEHLNWLPFVCPHCNASRASDIQMREHMHSFHKKNENKYIYLDNPQAKKLLQEIMDKALFGASAQFQQQQISRRNAVQTNGGAAHQQSADFELPAKRSRLEDGRGEKTTSTFKKIGEGSQQKQGMTTNSAVDQQNGEMEKQPVGEQSELFGVKSEFDMSALDGDSPSPHQSMLLPNEDDDLPDDNSHQQMDVLQKVTAMLSASSGGSGSDRFAGQGSRGGSLGKRMSGGFHKRIVRNRPGPMTSKKRVLGECQRCHKPITAGARQMHMFFHLGKDMQTYRFRCRHVGCDVEHYRKDQMENHQSKAHGRVDLEMMEDRTQELYNLVQKMSMELLGTAGNTPGPTAAKAQQLYDQQMRELQTQFGTRKRRLASPTPNSAATSSSNFAHRSNGPGGQMVDSANRKLEDLECRLCHKNIMSRIRGFHILWHLNNDLGIVRYGCKYCNFKHDRPQSVVAHGARDHGDDDACEDLLYNFESELKSMSKACFGVERLFEKEIRRRNKLERDANRLVAGADDPLMVVGDEDEDSQASDQLQQKTPAHRRTTAAIASLKVPLKVDERSWAASSSAPPKETVKKRRSLRRFGTRRTKSRKQKEEMIKLREVSMRLGGAQYFKKKTNEAVPCEKCGKMVSNRLSDHAYSHLEGCDLFRCQECNLGHFSRETIVRHLRDFHNSSDEPPLDNRLRFAQEIKDAIRECYPRLFVDAPIPTKEDIEKMKASLKSNMDMVLVSDKDGSEEDEDDEGDDEKEEEEEDDGEEEAKEEEEEHHVDELAEQTVDYEADGSGTNEEEAEADQQDGGDDEEVILDDDEEEEGEEGEEEGDDHDYEDELEEEEEMEEEFEEGEEAKEMEEDDEGGEEGEDEEEKFVIEEGGNSAAGQPKAGAIVGEGSAEKKNKKDTDIAAAAANVAAVAGAKTIAAAE